MSAPLPDGGLDGRRPRPLRILGTADEIGAVGRPLADHSAAQLLTVDEAAKRLRIGRTLCYALIQRGALAVVRFPGSRLVRVSARAIDELIRHGGSDAWE